MTNQVQTPRTERNWQLIGFFIIVGILGIFLLVISLQNNYLIKEINKLTKDIPQIQNATNQGYQLGYYTRQNEIINDNLDHQFSTVTFIYNNQTYIGKLVLQEVQQPIRG